MSISQKIPPITFHIKGDSVTESLKFYKELRINYISTRKALDSLIKYSGSIRNINTSLEREYSILWSRCDSLHKEMNLRQSICDTTLKECNEVALNYQKDLQIAIKESQEKHIFKKVVNYAIVAILASAVTIIFESFKGK